MQLPFTISVQIFEKSTVIVLGDIMLDRYIAGRVSRISPEAPIPVLHVSQETSMMGGAANVARNVASLGGKAILIGVIGSDAAGRELQAMIEAEPRISADLLELPDLPTIQKTRYIAGQQQLLRTDIEQRIPDASTDLYQAFMRHITEADAVVLSDYAKGTLTQELLALVISAARKEDIPIIVDPKHEDLSRYNGATILTPNRHEAAIATGIAGEGDSETALAANVILNQVCDTDAVLVTRGPYGMTLARRLGGVIHSPALAREVFDVSGAGDTVIATLTLTLALGAELDAAAHLANAAASIVVGKRGTATVTTEELRQILEPVRSLADFKIVDAASAAARAALWRERGEQIGFTNGCFDLIHPGHVSLLSQAKAQCDHLIVGLNSDASIKRLKGPGRPIQDELSRAIVLGSMANVDLVVLFDEDTPLELIRAIRPDVLIKGQDYTVDTVVGADFVHVHGGRVYLAELEVGHSTTNTVNRMKLST